MQLCERQLWRQVCRWTVMLAAVGAIAFGAAERAVAGMRADRATLSQAAADGNAERVATLLGQGADPNAASSGVSPPLIAAIAGGHVEIARELLMHGAEPNARVRSGEATGMPALMLAACREETSVVRLLLERGAEVDARAPSNRWTALFCAAERGNLDIVRLLIEHAADPGVVDGEGNTPYSLAELHPNVAAVISEARTRTLRQGKESARERWFSGLRRRGEVVEIEYLSTLPSGSVRYSLSARRHDRPIGLEITGRGTKGTLLMLSNADIQGFDNLLKLYRSKPRGQCGRTDEVRIVWKDDGVVVGEEAFVDRSCSPEATCGVVPLSVVGAEVFGQSPPQSRWGQPCSVAESAQMTRKMFQETFELLTRPGDGFARLVGMGFLLGLVGCLLFGIAPAIVGLALDQRLLGLLGTLASLATFTVLRPWLGFYSPVWIAGAFGLVILLRAYFQGRSPEQTAGK